MNRSNWSNNLSPKILAFLSAVALWFTVTNQLDFDVDLVFPIEYINQPNGLTSLGELPSSVSTRVRGQGKLLRYTTRGGTCRVDLSDCQLGTNTLMLDGNNLGLPADAQVIRSEILSPKRIVVVFDEVAEKDVAVRVAITGTPDRRYIQVGDTYVHPETVRIKGPKRYVAPVEEIVTEGFDITGRKNSLREEIPLVLSEHATVQISPEQVEVALAIEPIKTKTIPNVDLACCVEIDESWGALLLPSAMSLELRGAESLLAESSAGLGTVLLDADQWSKGQSVLQFEEIRGSQIIFIPSNEVPLVRAPSDQIADTGPLPSDRNKVPAAVSGAVVAQVALPQGVELLSVSPHRFTLVVGPDDERLHKIVRGDGSDSEPPQ